MSVVDAMFELTEGPVVVMKSHAATNLHANMRRGDIGRVSVPSDGLFLSDANGVHSRAEVHAPDGFGAKFTHKKWELGSLEIAANAFHEAG